MVGRTSEIKGNLYYFLSFFKKFGSLKERKIGQNQLKNFLKIIIIKIFCTKYKFNFNSRGMIVIIKIWNLWVLVYLMGELRLLFFVKSIKNFPTIQIWFQDCFNYAFLIFERPCIDRSLNCGLGTVTTPTRFKDNSCRPSGHL